MTIDIAAVQERVRSRAHGWSQTVGAPAPVKKAVAAHNDALTALDDALVEYEMEVLTRRSVLKQHNEAVAEALRNGTKPPAAKVPSLEEIEVRHGAIVAARESFVHEAASNADRVAREHYGQWRASAVEQLHSAAASVTDALATAAEALADWGSAAQVLARLDRNWTPRTARLDGAGVLDALEQWSRNSSIGTTDMANNCRTYTARVQEFTAAPIVAEYDPAGGAEQYSQAYLDEQSPGTRQVLQQLAAESPRAV